MHFVNCTALAAVLFNTLIEKLRLYSFAEAGIVLKFRAKMSLMFLLKKCN